MQQEYMQTTKGSDTRKSFRKKPCWVFLCRIFVCKVTQTFFDYRWKRPFSQGFLFFPFLSKTKKNKCFLEKNIGKKIPVRH
jgi:hypothetical protein